MATVENVSTKKINAGRNVTYNFRTQEDIYRFTNYVMNGNCRESPVYSSSKGFVSSKDDSKIISKEIEYLQKMYRKDKGIRIRGENVVIDKRELTCKDSKDLIKSIADGYSTYYMAQGFQNVYGVYEVGDIYEIRYALNPVSYSDGSKYRHNNKDIRDREGSCINTIIADATGKIIPEDQRFDFDTLEFSHFLSL